MRVGRNGSPCAVNVSDLAQLGCYIRHLADTASFSTMIFLAKIFQGLSFWGAPSFCHSEKIQLLKIRTLPGAGPKQ